MHRGALASLARTPLPSVDEVLDGARTVVVCEDIVDHTNVGAIFRSAAALGVDAVLLAPRCADPLYRRSVKVAMGAVFALPWTRLPDWYDALPDLERRGFTTVALTLAADAVPLEEAVSGLDRLALIARVGRSRFVRALGAVVRAAGGDPDAPRHRLAQRRGGHGGGLLRRGAPRNRPAGPEIPPIVCRVGWEAAPSDGVAATTSWRRCPTTPSSAWTRRAPSRPGTSVPRSVKGYTADEAIGRSFAMFYPEEDRAPGCR